MCKEIRRIVPGHGGDSVLVLGSEKTAVVDTGMAYCGEQLAVMAERELGGRPLDYVLLTHSHYDHAGGIPALRRRWPELIVVGSRHAKDVFRREGARRRIRALSQAAARLYLGEGADRLEYAAEEMRIDRTAEDGDVISLGKQSVRVLATPGHTNCSLSYYFYKEKDERKCCREDQAPPGGVLFTSESIGCYMEGGKMEASVLTSFRDAFASIDACELMMPGRIVSPHYGEVEDLEPREYFRLARGAARELHDFIAGCLREGMEPEEVLESGKKRYWESRGEERDEQPLTAFLINMKASINVVIREG